MALQLFISETEALRALELFLQASSKVRMSTKELVNDQGCAPLLSALYHHREQEQVHLQAIQWLIDQGADVNAEFRGDEQISPFLSQRSELLLGRKVTPLE